jgi:hypothetical protein
MKGIRYIRIDKTCHLQHENVENFVLIFLLFSNSVAKFRQLFVFPDFFHCSKDLVGNMLSFLSPNRKRLRFFTLLSPFLLFTQYS